MVKLDIGYLQEVLNVIDRNYEKNVIDGNYKKNEKHLFLVSVTGGFLLITLRIRNFIR